MDVVPAGQVVLEVQGLKKWFGRNEVLKGINLRVTGADAFCVIGPNGCGKSTFLRCLNLLENYQEGRVLLKGEVASVGRPDEHRPTREEQHRARHLRERVGMVFQQHNLFPHLSVIQNVMLGPQKVQGKTKTEAAEIAERTLEKVGLRDKANNDPQTLSGGQQQRVGIARALAMDPDVMLFDEATSALDPVLTQEVLRVIKKLVEEDGLTSILVTHDLDFARSIADRVLFMNQGRIEAEGTPDHVFNECDLSSLRSFLNPAKT